MQIQWSECAGNNLHSKCDLAFKHFSNYVVLPLMYPLWAHPSSANVDSCPSPEKLSRWMSSSSARGWTRSQLDKSRLSCLSASGLQCRCPQLEHLSESRVNSGQRKIEKQAGFHSVQTLQKLILQVSSAVVVAGVVIYCKNTPSYHHILCAS